MARLIHTNVIVRNIVWIDDESAQYGQTDDPPQVDAEKAEVIVHTVQARRIEFDFDKHVATIYP